MTLFDLKAYDLHQARTQSGFKRYTFLYEHVGKELTSRTQDIKRKFNKALNLSPHPLSYPSFHQPFRERSLTLPKESYDLIFSCLQGHWVNDLQTHLKEIHECLQPDGLFLGALWGGKTLWELRESLLQAELLVSGGVSPRIAPMLHPSDAPLLLGRAGFSSPVIDKETIIVTYSSLINLMRDLRGMGEANKLHDRLKTFTPRSLFEKAEDHYRQTYSLSGHKIQATFEVIYFTGWK
ncbi:MAG: class I SAM-dependent methyltransferase [Alphaproteobacteria bacterium]|nr:class I SAM-dependent methyltransferase [Alphaproteobacteria bacterium]